MNRIVCELLSVGEHKRQSDGKRYFSVRILVENKVVVLFFNDEGLYNNLSKLDRLSDICLLGDFKVKDDHSFLFVPSSFEM